MIQAIKKQTNTFLRKFGYQITQAREHDPRYQQVIRETENLYRELLFKDFPSSDEKRTALLSNLLGTNISEAIYILYYLSKSLDISGDICEFGVAQGATSALMANEVRTTDKNIWLFDSFEGLPRPTEKDVLKDDIFNLGSMEAYAGTMSFKADMVKRRLRDIDFPFSKVRIVPGFIEETIKHPNLPEKVAFAYVDFDFYEPILIALQFLDNVLQQGGFIVVDDYDFFSTGAKTGVEEFLSTRGDAYAMSLPIKSAGHFCILEKTGA